MSLSSRCEHCHTQRKSPAGAIQRGGCHRCRELINEERWRRASFCVKVGDGGAVAPCCVAERGLDQSALKLKAPPEVIQAGFLLLEQSLVAKPAAVNAYALLAV